MSGCDRFRGRRVAVFGLARSGLTAAQALRERFGARVVAWDDSERGRTEARALDLDVSDLLAEPAEDWAALILSPGVPLTRRTHPVAAKALAAGVPIIGDIELLWLSGTGGSFLGITGTNGKSTTTALIGHILKAAGWPVEVGGNLGIPVLSLPPVGEDGVSVIEMSSYQLDLVDETRFSVALLLNVTPDHLDRHGDMAGYVAAKSRIFRHQGGSDTAIVSIDDEYCRAVAQRLAAGGNRVVPISVGAPALGGVWVLDGILQDDGFPVLDLRPIAALPGRHNWQNAAAAYAAARAVGLTRGEIVRHMASFPGLAHRQEQLGSVGRIRFVNDSKATNADAAEKALDCYRNIRWIAGGVAKEGGIASLARFFPSLKGAYLIGESAAAFQGTIGDAAPVRQCGDLPTAVAAAYSDALADPEPSVILLSPACASFDQYPNFEVRGDTFRTIVHNVTDGALS